MSEIEFTNSLINTFTDMITSLREERYAISLSLDEKIILSYKEMLIRVKKQESALFNLLSKTTNNIIKESDLNPISTIIVSYVMDPVMWSIKYRIPVCKYSYIKLLRCLHIQYNITQKHIQIMNKSRNFDGTISEGDQILIEVGGNLIRVYEWTFSCKLSELTGDNFNEMAKRKEIE